MGILGRFSARGRAASRSLVLGLAGAGISCSASFASDVGILSHKAVYELSLVPRDNNSDWDTVSGRMIYEVLGSPCAGYTQNFRQVLVLSGPKFGQHVLDNYSTSTEDADGRSLQFLAKELDKDAVVQVTSGLTRRSGDDVVAHFNSPTQSDVPLEKNTLFPVAYTRALISEARAQHPVFSALQFDGTDQIKPILSSFAVIGGEQKGSAGLDQLLPTEGFAALRRWPVTIGFSNAALRDAGETEYSVFEELFENGVAQSLVLDFKDFKLNGKLVSISFPTQPVCK